MKERTLLREGYNANADIILDKIDSVLAIKEAILIPEEEKVFVELEKGDQVFEKREIQTGLSDCINIEILIGLDPDENIKKL